MLEISDYRLGEQLGRSTISNWRIAETHLVDHFIRVGFPVRIESRHEVGQLLDTMQEKRFEQFMTELGGLSAAEADSLTDALVSSVKFQMAHLPRRNPCVPFSTMLSSLTLYKKIVGIKPDVESVLEVGPGCGYLSYFLAGHESVRNYSQVEACESFYILQSPRLPIVPCTSIATSSSRLSWSMRKFLPIAASTIPGGRWAGCTRPSASTTS